MYNKAVVLNIAVFFHPAVSDAIVVGFSKPMVNVVDKHLINSFDNCRVISLINLKNMKIGNGIIPTIHYSVYGENKDLYFSNPEMLVKFKNVITSTISHYESLNYVIM